MKKSAGILLYKFSGGIPYFFLVHPGGPYFRNKNAGWWTIPKGELLPGEEPLQCAIREFEEETGYKPAGTFAELQPVTQKGGKLVMAWACKGDLNADEIRCYTFEIEWPPSSGKMQQSPEVDKACWFNANEALQVINHMQQSFIKEALTKIS